MSKTPSGQFEGEIRLQKYLSRAGVASRREAEVLIDAGRVAVNGETITEQGVRVMPGEDEVTVNGKLVTEAEVKWIVYHKPVGLLTTTKDPFGGKTVYDALPKWAKGLRYVGRLDRETSGLLLLTNDGDLAAKLAHPRNKIEREYEVVVGGQITAKALRQLKAGVDLEDGFARPKRVRRIAMEQKFSRVSVVLTEGKKREVRRLLEAVGHSVRELERKRFGPFVLGGLEVGAWRPAWAAELTEARRLTSPRRTYRRRG